MKRMPFPEQLLRGLATLLFVLGCLMIVQVGLDLGGDWQKLALMTAVCVGILMVISIRPAVLLVAWVALMLILALVLFRVMPDSYDHLVTDATEIGRWITGHTDLSQELARRLDLPLVVLFSLLSFPLFRLRLGAFPVLSLLGLVTGAFWFMQNADPILPWTLPCLFAIVLLYGLAHIDALRAERQFYSRVSLTMLLAVTAMLIAGAWFLLPKEPPKWSQLSSAIDRLVDQLRDQPNLSAPRTPYNSRMSGLQPLGARLGGPVAPSDSVVMRVTGGTPTLLRGTMRNNYDGNNWSDTLQSRRYALEGFSSNALSRRAFDQELPSGLDTSERLNLYITNNYSIELYGANASTLFIPQRIKELEFVTDMQAYFNLSGEIFLLENIPNGSQYTVQTNTINRSSSYLESILERGADRSDSNYAQICEDYLRIPPGVDAQVKRLAESVTHGLTPYRQALALERHLRENYRYTLTPEVPPRDRDFVSHFLVDTKEGYCTYFASAMAIMARQAGLPSRYVEGYSMNSPPENGVYNLSSQNAHAWVEIYFKGFGWLAFDPTPGGGSPDLFSPESNVTPQPEPDASPAPEDEEGATEPPEITPTPEPDEETDAPIPTPQLVTPPPGSTPPPQEEVEPPPEPFVMPGWAIAVLWGLGITGLMALWFLATFPRFHRRWLSEAAMAARIYSDMLHMARFMGYPLQPSDTLHKHGVRVDQALSLFDHAMTKSADIMGEMTYGGQNADADMIAQLDRHHHELIRAIRFTKGEVVFFFVRLRIPPLPRISSR